MTEAFYVRSGDRFASTAHTRGPWAEGLQHGGPPSALLAHEIERLHPRDDAAIARITLEIVRPVPIAHVAVDTTVVRPGRKVELIGASLTADGVVCIRAHAWRIRTTSLELPQGAGASGPPPPPLSTARPMPFFPSGHDVGYHTAMDVYFAEGGFTELGPASVWMRMRVPLVEGEPTTALCRVLCAADSGNGVSAALDFRRWIFINPDLTVYLHRPLEGEWVHMAARTTLSPTGLGMAESTLSDASGPVGRGLQSLYLEDRHAPGT